MDAETKYSGDDIDSLTPEITVLGIGNIILRDEGFGVRVVEYLESHYEFPDNVQVLDGGTLGMELLRFITGTKKLLVLDAVKTDRTGEILTFKGNDVTAHFGAKMSAHEAGIQDVLTLLDLTGKSPDEIVLIGCAPENIDAGLELSNTLSSAVEKAAGAVVDELASWGAELKFIEGTK